MTNQHEAATVSPLWRSRPVTDGLRITRLYCVTKPLHSRRSSIGLRPDGIICLTPWPRLWNATNTFFDWLQAKLYLLTLSHTLAYVCLSQAGSKSSKEVDTLKERWVCSGTPHISKSGFGEVLPKTNGVASLSEKFWICWGLKMPFRFTAVTENLVLVTPFNNFKNPCEVTESGLIPGVM